MRKTLFVLLLLLGCTSDEPSHPISHPTLVRRAYFASYDGQRKQPSWVYERLTATTLQGDVERDGFSFVEDPNLPKSLRSSNADYKGSSFAPQGMLIAILKPWRKLFTSRISALKSPPSIEAFGESSKPMFVDSLKNILSCTSTQVLSIFPIKIKMVKGM